DGGRGAAEAEGGQLQPGRGEGEDRGGQGGDEQVSNKASADLRGGRPAQGARHAPETTRWMIYSGKGGVDDEISRVAPSAVRAAARRLRCPRADRPPAVVERRAGQAGDPRVREGDHRPGEPEIRASRGTHRRVRPGRHHLGRAADVRPGRVRASPGRDGGGEGPEAE